MMTKPIVSMDAIENYRIKTEQLLELARQELNNGNMANYRRAFAEYRECNATYLTLLRTRYNLG